MFSILASSLFSVAFNIETEDFNIDLYEIAKGWAFKLLPTVYSYGKEAKLIPSSLSLASLKPSFEGFPFHLLSSPLTVTLRVSLSLS